MLVPARRNAWQHLIASGQVVQPTETGDVLDEAPSDFRIDATGTLVAMREDER